MALDPRQPVIVGVGQVSHRADGLDDALSPVALMAEAVRRAATDAQLASVPTPDSMQVVSILSWRSADPARIVAGELGISPGETVVGVAGGNTPQAMLNAACRDIVAGRFGCVVLTGAEAWRTRMRARRDGVELDWPTTPEGMVADRVAGADVALFTDREASLEVYLPVQTYPMFESAWRAGLGRTPADHLVAISELWARFAEIAATNPYAWVRSQPTAEEIRTAGPSNRMIGLPYTKLLNSNNDVDQSAALLVCSVERARELGVPEDRWVFPHAGADAHEHLFVSDRDRLTDVPAVRLGGRAVLELAGVDLDDIELIDLYSCFPSAVQIGANALGLSLDRQLTRTGGLTFAGGPWNNYPMHAIATIVGELRERPTERAFVWANGGYLTKHAFGVYATTPPQAGFRWSSPQDAVDALPRRHALGPSEATGVHEIEAYTVMHGRDGSPEKAVVSCAIGPDARAWASSTDADVIAALVGDEEMVGRRVRLDAEGNLGVEP